MALSKAGARVGGAAAIAAVALTLGASAMVRAEAGGILLPSGEQLTGDLIGAPTPVLLESNWSNASGKVAVITGADPAIESRTIATEADDLVDQIIWMYPLVDAEGTYVLANGDGDVVSRIDGSRYLETLDVTGDEAAASGLSTWVPSTTGDVTTMQNVEQLDGETQVFDLYDWDTSENADIQSYSSTGAAVQQWVMHDLVASTGLVGELVAPGAAPDVPTTATGTYSWGLTTELTDIEWDMPEQSVWDADGTVEFTGTAAGAFGETVTLAASYTVGTVGDAEPETLSSYAGVLLSQLKKLAPSTVERTVSGTTTTVTADVEWDWDAISQDDLDEVGTITVNGAEDLGFAATLEITLGEPASVNVLRTADWRAWQFYYNTVSYSGLTDGDTSTSVFGDWRSGGASNRVEENWVAFYFDEPQQIDAAALYEASGVNNIGSVTFQYRDMHGGWVDTSAGAVANGDSTAAIEVDFDSVLATGFRAVFTHKGTSTWMQLAEIEAWGPSAA
ncbi:Ig-like domain-containing protein [Demequina sp. NBRC 110054]|uniref:Ig-like domain-containing protein n=1 Tax=Demequina sp. NBRC 110054 TaxID=1570343 RepID=UPI0009FD6AAF|nr:Ig-like domain-containing protein [Demequina sp. NBRC 110054]